MSPSELTSSVRKVAHILALFGFSRYVYSCKVIYTRDADGALVAIDLGVAGLDGAVERAAVDLLEQNVTGSAVDAVVRWGGLYLVTRHGAGSRPEWERTAAPRHKCAAP